MLLHAASFPQELREPDAAAHGRWLSVLSHLHPRYGGLSAVVPQLAQQLAQRGFATTLDAFCLPGEHYAPEGQIPIRYWPVSRSQWLTGRDLQTRFRDYVSQADGLHIHGLWDASTLIAARAAQATHTPYILSAHGMLEPWALGSGRLKKQIYAAVFEKRTAKRAHCLHALTHAEADAYRRFGASAPIAVIPNAVSVPRARSSEFFLNAFPAARGKRLLLFLGRLHPKKGVAMLLDAWAQLAPQWPDASLVLAGPCDPSAEAIIAAKSAPLLRDGNLILTGLLAGDTKWSALAAAECFVLPSYSEGLSIAALEAMGAGVPVLLTENCNLPEAAQAGCGWEIRAEREPLREALQACLRNTPVMNRASGARGAALVRRCYSWQVVGAQMAELYGWVQTHSIPTTFDLQER